MKVSPFVSLLDPEAATIPMNSNAPDVQPLSSGFVKSFARAVIFNVLHPPADLHDWERPPGWESRLGELYQLGTVVPPMIAVPVGRRHDRDPDGNKLIFSVKS